MSLGVQRRSAWQDVAGPRVLLAALLNLRNVGCLLLLPGGFLLLRSLARRLVRGIVPQMNPQWFRA